MSKYRSPFTAKCHMTTPFKKKGNWAAGYHTGEDWVADGDRTLVAPTSGTVSYVSSSGSYGNHLIIHTDDGNCILMAHMASLPCVKVGQHVKAGDKVGVEGSTGNSTGLHLHIEVEKGTNWNYNKNLLKPSDYIDFNNFGKDDEDMLAYKELLRILQYKGVIKTKVDENGIVGTGTVNATKELQKIAGIAQTGKVNETTIKAAYKLIRAKDEAYTKSKNAQINAKSMAIKAAIEQLSKA